LAQRFKKKLRTNGRLKARVNFLEQKAINTDNTLQELLTSIQEIKVAIAKIDTKISQNSNN